MRKIQKGTLWGEGGGLGFRVYGKVKGITFCSVLCGWFELSQVRLRNSKIMHVVKQVDSQGITLVIIQASTIHPQSRL